MLIRTDHNRENPYVMIHQDAIRDSNLSYKARGLYAEFMSNAAGWEISVEVLSKKGKEGKRAIYSALKELINEGYCIRSQDKHLDPISKRWVFGKVIYTIYERKKAKLKKCLPQSGFEQAQNSNALRKTKAIPKGIAKETTTSKPLPKKKPSTKPSFKTVVVSPYKCLEKFTITSQSLHDLMKYPEEKVEKALAYAKTKKPRCLVPYLLKCLKENYADEQVDGHLQVTQNKNLAKKLEDVFRRLSQRDQDGKSVYANTDHLNLNPGGEHNGFFIRYDDFNFLEKCEMYLKEWRMFTKLKHIFQH